MIAIDTALTTDRLGAEGCSTLPVVSDGRGFSSFWKPTPEELAALAAGATVQLIVLGSGHPPVSLYVNNPEWTKEIERLSARLEPA